MLYRWIVYIYEHRYEWSQMWNSVMTSLPFRRKLRVIVSSGEGFQVHISQLMLQGPSTKSHQTLPETRSLLLWLTLVNKGKCVYVCLSVCAYPLFSLSFSQHYPKQNISYGSRLSERTRPQLAVNVCECTVGMVKSLIYLLKTESATIHAIYFNRAFTVMQDVNACYWDILKCHHILFESYFLFK